MELIQNKRFEYKNLPDMKTIMNEVDDITKDLSIGQTLFMKEKNVKSEAEYKKKMAAERKIMKHSHIGWNSWDETARGTEKIYNELTKRGSYVDRFGYCLDWIMGVPEDKRHILPVGTGLIFDTPDEWKKVGEVVPVQPHFGDHMIGSCNSLENAVNALKAGSTTIGNIAHYFTYEYPGIDMEEERVIDMIKAIGVMGKFREQGTIIHSNLDDGFGAQLHDLSNLVGYAMIERYVCEELLGAGLNHCYGNLFSDPILRIIFGQAMKKINKTETPGSMVYGNTIDFGTDLDRNYGALSSFVLGDILNQNYNPTGHAVTVIPVTEALRIPTAEEIISAHMTVDIMIEKSKFYEPYINFEKIDIEANLLVSTGNIFFERVMNGLDSIGVDIEHPGEVLGALKAIGIEQLESNFGVGKSDKNAMRGRIPVWPTNIVKTINDKQNKIIDKTKKNGNELEGTKIITCSTDIHEFGKEIVKGVVINSGATVFDLGSNVTVQEIVDTIVETESKIILISTFNGIALSFARELNELLKNNDLDVKIFMGGLLNENEGESEIPVDVSDKLISLGINVDNNAETLVSSIESI